MVKKIRGCHNMIFGRADRGGRGVDRGLSAGPCLAGVIGAAVLRRCRDRMRRWNYTRRVIFVSGRVVSGTVAAGGVSAGMFSAPSCGAIVPAVVVRARFCTAPYSAPDGDALTFSGCTSPSSPPSCNTKTQISRGVCVFVSERIPITNLGSIPTDYFFSFAKKSLTCSFAMMPSLNM